MDTEIETNETPNVADQGTDDQSTSTDVGSNDTDLSTSVDTSVDESGQSTDDANGSDQTPELDDKTPQDKLNYAFAKKQSELRAANARAEEADAKLAEATAKLNELTVKKRPVVPELPDTYDADYAAKMALRDQAIKDQGQWDAAAKNQETARAQLQQQAITDRQTEIRDKESKYFERGEALGFTSKELGDIGDKIAPYITPANAATVEYLLEREDGPLIVKYLQANPIELDKVSNMAPLHASVYISTDLSTKAKALKPATTKTPAPIETLDGAAPSKDENPLIKGAIFE